MKRLFVLLLCLPAAWPAFALSPEAQEFMEISAQLEPVQCEKRRMRRALVLAEVERRDAEVKQLRARADEINRDQQTARLEKRLAVLEARLMDSRGQPRSAGDLDAISFQQRQAFYRCE